LRQLLRSHPYLAVDRGRIPGKEEFSESIRYFRRRIEVTGVGLHLGSPVTAAQLRDGGFDEVVVATGVEPRVPSIPGVDHPSVMTYAGASCASEPGCNSTRLSLRG
jgi:NADPH-dependent 2,4-dienoyl-CoA reductase/sulfur reductase-like enzyme